MNTHHFNVPHGRVQPQLNPDDTDDTQWKEPDPTAIEDSSIDKIPFIVDDVVSLPLPQGNQPRNFSLIVLATVAFIFGLIAAQKFLVPLLLGIFISYTLNPMVVWLEKRRLPRLFGTVLVVTAILVGLAVACLTLQTEFQSILETLPESTQKISRAISESQDGHPSTMEKMQKAASEIENATHTKSDLKKGVGNQFLAQPPFKVSDWLWAGSMGIAGFIGQATTVAFLVFFLLLSGDIFKRKLVKLAGPTLTQKKITVHILDNINTTVQNYMLMLLVTNSLLALLMWIALRVIGLENAGAWAIVAGVTHVVPYFGPLLISAATGVSAFIQFESFSMALLVASISLVIATLVGTFVTTWMTGRIAKRNTAAVFISLLFWGWLWGVWGLLLGVPIVVILKVISERIEGFEFVSEMLGE